MKKIIIILLLVMMSFASVKASENMIAEIIDKNSIESEHYKQAGSEYDWLVFATSQYDEHFSKGTYLFYLNEYIKTNSQSLATDYAKCALVATSFGDHQFALDCLSHITVDLMARQGLNAYIWTLIALDSFNYSTELNRNQLIDYIINCELQNGGFTYYKNDPEVDMTAMAIVSLARYKDMENVKAVIERGMSFLKNAQHCEGYFENYGVANAESTAWAIIASTTINLNPKTFYTYNVIDGLMAFYKDASFSHTTTGKPSLVPTYQGLYALISLERHSENQKPLFDLTDTLPLQILPSEEERLNELATLPVSMKHYDEVMGLCYLSNSTTSDLAIKYQNHKLYLDDLNKKITELLKVKDKKEIEILKQQIIELPEYDKGLLNDYSELFEKKPYWIIPVALVLVVGLILILKGRRK